MASPLSQLLFLIIVYLNSNSPPTTHALQYGIQATSLPPLSSILHTAHPASKARVLLDNLGLPELACILMKHLYLHPCHCLFISLSQSNLMNFSIILGQVVLYSPYEQAWLMPLLQHSSNLQLSTAPDRSPSDWLSFSPDRESVPSPYISCDHSWVCAPSSPAGYIGI